MVKCDDCGQEMKTAIHCSKMFSGIVLNEKKYKRDTTYYDVNHNCHDCGIYNNAGNLHHYGCDIERCPRCKGQLISCNCKKGNLFQFGNKGIKVKAHKRQLR